MPRTRTRTTPVTGKAETGKSTAVEMGEGENARAPLLGNRASGSLSQRQRQPLSQRSSSSPTPPKDDNEMEFKDLSRKSQWIALAVMSGACAAFNGMFAKLTTTELTTSFATAIANLLGLGNGEKVVEVIVRGLFFALNLLFNAIMWTLFTKALARGTSTTQVSIINTSSNFMLTAVLGWLIFSESLPPLWFLGAALLVAGNVIIGRREEKEVGVGGADLEGGEGRKSGEAEAEAAGLLGEVEEVEFELEEGGEGRKDEDVVQLGDLEEDLKSDDDELVDLRNR